MQICLRTQLVGFNMSMLPSDFTLMKHFTLFLALAVGLGLLDSHAQIFNPTKRVMVEDHTTGGAWTDGGPRGIVHLEQFMMETPATDYEVACIHGNNGADYEYGNFDAMFLASYSNPAANTDLMMLLFRWIEKQLAATKPQPPFLSSTIPCLATSVTPI